MIELYAYVDGSDLEDESDHLMRAFEEFVSNRRWKTVVWVVNQREQALPYGDDLPDWSLGLNLRAASADPGYWEDVWQILRFLDRLHTQTGRDFAVGLSGEDRLYIDGRDLHEEEVTVMLGG